MLRIVVPARIDSARLPGKMLELIGTRPLVEHAVRRVLAASGGAPVYLATDAAEIEDAIAPLDLPVRIVRTSSSCRSGTDRCAEVAESLSFADGDVVVNVQADMPFLHHDHLSGFLAVAEKRGWWDLLTAICDVRVVRAQVDNFLRDAMALHVGLYAYKRPALRRFAGLPTGEAEAALKLEQMRAVENGFSIAFHALPEMPLEINTPGDLATARHIAQCLS